MGQLTFEEQVLKKLDRVERSVHHILEHIEDSKLSDEEKELLEESYKHEKEGKLISSKELSRNLGL